jgi:hypothetical protein
MPLAGHDPAISATARPPGSAYISITVYKNELRGAENCYLVSVKRRVSFC